MKVLIRADASSAIGTGHLMRCLALAQALRDHDHDVLLVTALDPGPLAEYWHREEVGIQVIDTDIGSLRDAAETREIAEGAGWVVLDGYAFGAAYRSELRGGPRLLLVDDHGAASLDADLVVNGNLYATEALYPTSRARLLLGATYALLRREIRQAIRPPSPQGILLSLGGSDPENMTVPILHALAEAGLRGRVVIGPRHPSPHDVRQAAGALGWEAVDSPEGMAGLLASVAVAVVGAGTTTLECAALGVPMVAVKIAENQVLVARALDEQGLAVAADGQDPSGVAAAAVALASDASRREDMARRGPARVDGRGAIRVARTMQERLLALRAATEGDARILHRWANEAAARAASFDTRPIAWNEHLAWLHRTLASSDAAIYVGELDGRAVGVVRLERQGRVATISLTVDPGARRRGLASPLIRAAIDAAAGMNVDTVEAFLRPDNLPSRRAFTSAGFREVARGQDESAPPDALRMVASVDLRG